MITIKILGIVGSKRKNGNTSIVVQKALDETQHEGAQTELLYLSDYQYSDCNGCEGCAKDFRCVIEDGMQQIYPKILEADGIVVGSPTYFYNLTALMKAFIDRLYCYEIFDNEDRSVWMPLNEALGMKYALVIAICEQQSPEDLGFTDQAMSKPLAALGYRVTDTLKILHAFEKGDVSSQPETLTKVQEAGKRLAKTVKLREQLLSRK
ncbi:MAG: flavodoxin family protein [Thermotogota bacterium]